MDIIARHSIKTPAKRRSSSGFTLMEVTIAFTILAVMMTLNYRILKGVVTAKELIDDRRDGMFIANSLLTRMSRELQLAVKRPILPSCDTASAGTSSSSDQAQSASGSNPSQSSFGRPVLISQSDLEGSSITFLAKEAGQYIPDGGTHSGVVQITYRVAQDPDQKGSQDATYLLVREEIPNSKPLSKACKSVLRFPISNNLISLQFRFFDGKAREWGDTWTGQQAIRLPEIIQFTVALRSPRGTVQSYTTAVHVAAS